MRLIIIVLLFIGVAFSVLYLIGERHCKKLYDIARTASVRGIDSIQAVTVPYVVCQGKNRISVGLDVLRGKAE